MSAQSEPKPETPNNAVATVDAPAMTSLELVDVINEVRSLNGKPKLQHKHLIDKIESHPGIQPAEFSAGYIDAKGETRKLYNLPERECNLLVMSESLAIQAQVYDKLIDALRVAHRSKAQPRLQTDTEIGTALKKAIRMEDHDSAAELEGVLNKLDLASAAHAQGIPVEAVRRQVGAHVSATMLLDRMRRGEHQHDNPIKDVVKWARSVVHAEDAKAQVLAYERDRIKSIPQTLEQIVAHELTHKHGATK